MTLIGGGPVPPGALAAVRAIAPDVVATDSGADLALAQGLSPLAVIGDLDSIGAAARAAFADRLVEIAEQETTDLDKTLRHVAAPLLLGVGFSGGRIDHELAAIHVLLAHPGRACLLVGSESLMFLCPPEIRLDLAPGTPLSLFPMGPVRCASEGLRWPTEGIDFAPAGRIGTSNEVTGPVSLAPDAPRMLVILPAAALTAVVGPLGAFGRRWPARAR